ncbi:SAM-dependent methyltransferase [Nocardioides sp. MAH-18]|uniref:S-adenosyl-L-methionine-dependent methyltransferase n=1 Tax=Nocardioides agri TaxID=2682843 RepID=A0A6L6XVC3_9ACTN|nr:class I SAM-dependent methyltransferase [Nocardioides sp. CGMCC 1.13656]MBA2956307.1 class I SAM-dependent methyltransferase [Nocardioides sp. CGMCC 1.13656]MVQ51150.1 SAM-dependent methyltransferase [Nocardioides sp. MAH-18]
MREGEPSRTALGAAMLRAAHQDDEPLIFADPLAHRILGDPDQMPDRAWAQPRLRLFIAVRHRFGEDSLAAAVARGTRQVVVLGAGLDTFAYRNPHPGTRVFEVDCPATGAWKRERLAEAGIEVPDDLTYVGVDFETDSLAARLEAAGFDASRPAFFLWLGVVPYLSDAAVRATLAVIAAVPQGEVVLDYIRSVEAAPTLARSDRVTLEAHVADVGEPLQAGRDTAAMHAMLRGAGFEEIEELGRREIRVRYLRLPPGEADGDAHVVRALSRR